MAIPKSNIKVKDVVTADTMWKTLIRSEDESDKTWKFHWGWILEEYGKLKKKLDEKTETSEFLTGVIEVKKEDNRKLSKVPESLNHFYGWVAERKEFELEKYGQDFFKPMPLPDIYKIPKH